MTLALLGLLKERGYSCGVVSRGYKRGKKGVHPVITGPAAAFEFGDEPVMIKTALPGNSRGGG